MALYLLPLNVVTALVELRNKSSINLRMKCDQKYAFKLITPAAARHPVVTRKQYVRSTIIEQRMVVAASSD